MKRAYEDEHGKSVRNHPCTMEKSPLQIHTILDYGFEKTNTIYKEVLLVQWVTNYKIFLEFFAPLMRNSELVLKLIIIIGGIFSLIKYV